MQSFIIHMSSATKRRANVDTLCTLLPEAEIVEAETGPSQIERSRNLYLPRYPFTLGRGEIGCTLSHRKCWQMIVDRGLDYALIAEDDLAIDTSLWDDALSLIAQHATPDHFIRLPAKRREDPQETIASRGQAAFFLPKIVGPQTVCQVVGRNAARRLLNATRRMDRPIDTFLQMHWIHKQPIHTILPNGVSELTEQLGGSTIQARTNWIDKLRREWRRMAYRRRVARRPQQVITPRRM